MLSTVGRPREHNEATATALLDKAERAVEAEGLAALSVRAVAAEAGTTTRAVYSLFGSKDGLVVALGVRAYKLLDAAVAALPVTDDAAADLVDAGLVFRRFARDHPALFMIGVQRVLPVPELWDQFRGAASTALSRLCFRLDRLAERQGLGGRSTMEAAWQFHALCEGLAAAELRDLGRIHDFEARWHAALSALVHGFAAAPIAEQL
jgi:AcrR family transcriptional regulator